VTDGTRAQSGARSDLDPGFLKGIGRGLDGAFERADELELDLDSTRLVVFSDHHRGARDGADDFLRCESAYAAALGWYLEAGYRLCVLGDVEELWKYSPRSVLEAYRDVLRLEAAFHERGRYERFWGNHDDDWARAGARRLLEDRFPGLHVREGLRLRLLRGDEPPALLFLVHGHQGTKESDRFAWFSRLVVRVGWRRIQRSFGLAGSTPARDFDLRARHDRAMFKWARGREERPILIAGHTHRPVFWTSTPPAPRLRNTDEIERDLAERRAAGAGPEDLAALRAELEFALAEAREERTAFTLAPPCYFNTGCCSYGDGDVTGIELADGELRLVRWPDDEGRPARKILASEPLSAVLGAMAAGVEAEAVEVPV
jgi:UDP-2,3-diacylglucosamine pyrophosphatase LpxH